MNALQRKIVFRALAAALAGVPLAIGCSANGDPLVLEDELDAGAPHAPDAGREAGPEADAGNPPDAGPRPTETCGNKHVDPGEECDDGNTTSGDGCSATCKRESAGPGDFCAEAIELSLAPGAGTALTASATGSTAALFNHYSASCGGGSGADAVYTVTSPVVGRAVARISATFPAILSVRTACEDLKTELACKDTTVSASGATEIAFPVFAGAPAYLFVDGFAGTSGDYTLDLTVDTAFCGNGVAEHPEQCDDGNLVDGDGCSATCQLEDTSAASACPGMAYYLTDAVGFAGDTSTMSNGGGSATACGVPGTTNSGAGPNAIYAITPAVTGALSLDLLADYPNALLHLRRECSGTSNASQFGCVAGTAPLTPLSTTVPVFAEQTIYAFVDSSASANAGLYTLAARLTPAACGNGVVDGGEECDDGNLDDGDGCSAACAVEVATASHTCPGEPVRLEGAAPGPRTASFHGSTKPVSGAPATKWTTGCGSAAPDVVYALTSDVDGYLAATVKAGFNATVSLRAACDPGTTVPAVCTREATGNAPKVLRAPVDKDKPYYLVVDGYAADASGAFEVTLEVTPSVCGNGVVEGGETCDDGGTDDGDGCSATCQLETDKARDKCATAPPITLAAKPDGTFGASLASGTTGLVHDITLTSCSSAGPDAFFTVKAPESGVMTATIRSATFRSTIGARSACPSAGVQIGCDATPADGGQEITFPVTKDATYYLVVDGQNVTGRQNYGRFTLDVTITPSGCGDGFVVPPEACDDGNTIDGDGCSSTCEREPMPAFAGCPGHEVTLTGVGNAVRRGVLSVSTAGLASSTGSACGGSGPEGIVRLTSDVSGALEVRATADFNALLHARTSCADPASEIPRASCTNSRGVFTTYVQKNVPTYLFVDGMNGASGAAKLQITVTP